MVKISLPYESLKRDRGGGERERENKWMCTHRGEIHIHLCVFIWGSGSVSFRCCSSEAVTSVCELRVPHLEFTNQTWLTGRWAPKTPFSLLLQQWDYTNCHHPTPSFVCEFWGQNSGPCDYTTGTLLAGLYLPGQENISHRQMMANNQKHHKHRKSFFLTNTNK